jgi:hypothetical protein
MLEYLLGRIFFQKDIFLHSLSNMTFPAFVVALNMQQSVSSDNDILTKAWIAV